MARPALSVVLALLLSSSVALAQQSAKARAGGVRPTGADGKPLNLDFETGTLEGWQLTGDAFAGQPIKGDTVHARRGDMKSEHAGQYWIGTYERGQDKPQGTLTSTKFTVTQPWCSFLVAGGDDARTCVELVSAQTDKVFFRASGHQTENLEPVAVDLRPHVGKQIYIRLVDKHSGGWGHINFDDFLFHAQQPKFPKRPSARPAKVDQYAHAGLTGEEAAAAMTLPEGFKSTLYAAEPDVQQPIAMALDDRGRLWIAEAYSYPVRVADKDAKDRILIFEDTDNDGKFDNRKVFIEGLNLVSGLEVGFGGVWVGAAPNFLFIPDANHDDKPDGPPQILLDGWGYQDTHETLNAFIWGPDGWLYGCHGVFTHSRVGKPGTPDKDRIPLNCAIWRYHPTRHEFEVFAHGTSNPWGVDFNDRGQCFLTCCVIPHLFHIIQGARYHRQGGQHFNPFTYDDIKTIAKHRHYLGPNPHGGNNKSDEAGGGHAHAGAMIYLGGKWPATYRDQIFMNNIHGQRLNMDQLAAAGSGYVGDRAPDFLLANDRWSQILNMRYGPDGDVYIIDWYDKQACHTRNINDHDRSNGRIFKITYQAGKKVPVDLATFNLAQKSDAELVGLQLADNDYYVRHGRRILQERAARNKLKSDTRAALAKFAFEHADDTRRLRGLWALHVTGGLSPEQLGKALTDASPYVRGWTIQLALETGRPTDALLEQLAALAQQDPSPVVRLYLASAADRLPVELRWNLMSALTQHAEDAGDHNLPVLYWCAAEPLAALDAGRALELALASKVPPLPSFMVRRIAAIGNDESIALLVTALGKAEGNRQQLTLLEGINTALRGRRHVDMPKSWPAVAAALGKNNDQRVRSQVRALSVTFGDAGAQGAMRELLADRKADLKLRQEALASLLGAKDKQLVPVLQGLLDDAALRSDVLRGLAAYEDPATPSKILAIYSQLDPAEKRDALGTLSSRKTYAKALLSAVGAKKLPSTDLTADLIRQLTNLNDAEITGQIEKVWGVVRATAADKAKLLAEYKRKLTTGKQPKPNLHLGRAVFAKTCSQCHTLFGTGGKVGPELTGSNRANLDYLLSNVLDPSAVMAKEYMPQVIATTDGRVITGLIKAEDANALTVQTATELVIVPKNEIDEMQQSTKSMMPDDLLKPLSDEHVSALVSYLASPAQVPMLATPDNVKLFFNGKDLTNWSGDPNLWSVENGEIVGRTATGIKRNQWLRSHLLAGDFRLKVEVKLVDNQGNSGIQFRSEELKEGEVKGYQADIGAGWWGKLYEEHGRALLWKESGEKHVKSGAWNTYEVVAVGDRIRTYLNGQLCVDLRDPPGAKRGIIAFQLHSGGPTEVRYRNLQLELDPAIELAGKNE